MDRNKKIEQHFTICLALSILLAVLLYFLAFMLFYNLEPVRIDLNGGENVIEEYEYSFEPGTFIEKPFYIGNEGSWDVYYKIYLSNVSGELAKKLEVSILNGETVLYSGTAESLNKDSVSATDDILPPGERRYLTIRFHLPMTENSATDNMSLKFDICADAVQMRNNPDKKFD